MALTTFAFGDPFLADIERSMDRAINKAFGTIMPSSALATARPGAPSSNALAQYHAPMDIIETDKAYELHTDAPGLSPEDLKVEFHEGVLTVAGSRKIAREEKDAQGKVWRSERSSYSFSRAFTLPDNANPDAISAGLDKGVLTVVLPKREAPPKPQPRRITVAGPAVAGPAPVEPSSAQQ